MVLGLCSLRLLLNLDFFDLQCIQLDRRVAAEHADQYLDLTLLGIDLVDGAVKALERSVNNTDNLANVEVDTMLRLGNTHALLDLGHLFVRDRRRLGAATNEASNTRGVADDVPCVFGHL